MQDESLLGYALLGLLHGQPLSGYDLRKLFASSPMGGFSDSPGAIYPALRRLERRGLVRGQLRQAAGLRRRRVYRLTPRGLAALKAWQSKPIRREDVMRRMEELLLRFAFMDHTTGPGRSLAFLRELARQLSSYIPVLEEYLDSHAKEMPLSGRLSLESGIEEYEARLRWARKSIARYERRKRGRQ
jgi:DNA-binding PadR family transcriptional regulator